MTKEVLDRILESGIIPTHAVRLMKVWQAIPDDAPEVTLKEKTEEEVRRIVIELGRVLETEEEVPELRETNLDVSTIIKEQNVHIEFRYTELDFGIHLYGAFDRNKKLIIPCPGTIEFGGKTFSDDIISQGTLILVEGNKMEIINMEPLFTGENVSHYICEVVNA